MSFNSKNRNSSQKSSLIPKIEEDGDISSQTEGPLAINVLELPKPFKNPSYSNSKRIKSAKQLISAEKTRDWPSNFPTMWSIAQPPSLKPAHKYCDVTGLEAAYKDPKTNLRYHSAEIYKAIKILPPGSEQAYLSIRNANVILR
ncbi:hypothetical protein BB560_000824 [Smittium megazygosporum]|uniref:Vps72/YL1 C-terminal domain-containing protein n=1 Tax=Smittium megazygosporum TaxID=133381 RepID=A0A2T9ZJA6_9FUNG|nr:hypothetical protein BB560_000824 [Smittium megazygosporum]